MKLFRWSELEALLSRHGTIVGASAAGLLPAAEAEEPELREFLVRTELELADEPGALSCGQHILAVVRKTREEARDLSHGRGQRRPSSRRPRSTEAPT